MQVATSPTKDWLQIGQMESVSFWNVWMCVCLLRMQMCSVCVWGGGMRKGVEHGPLVSPILYHILLLTHYSPAIFPPTSGAQLWVFYWDPPRAALQQGEAAQQRRQMGKGDCSQHTSRLLVPLNVYSSVCGCIVMWLSRDIENGGSINRRSWMLNGASDFRWVLRRSPQDS